MLKQDNSPGKKDGSQTPWWLWLHHAMKRFEERYARQVLAVLLLFWGFFVGVYVFVMSITRSYPDGYTEPTDLLCALGVVINVLGAVIIYGFITMKRRGK